MKKQRSSLETFIDRYGALMQHAHADFEEHVAGKDWGAVLDFFRENDHALLAPDALHFIFTTRTRICLLAKGNAEERKQSAALSRELLELLTVYATPKPSRAMQTAEANMKQAIAGVKMAIARTAALLDYVNTGEKQSVALARHAAEIGLVKPKPNATATSRAVQRAEQRARKKAGEPPRRRGRPPRLR